MLSEIDLSVNSFWFAIYLLVSLNQVTFCLLSVYWPFSLCSWSLLLVDLRFIGYVANNICKKRLRFPQPGYCLLSPPQTSFIDLGWRHIILYNQVREYYPWYVKHDVLMYLYVKECTSSRTRCTKYHVAARKQWHEIFVTFWDYILKNIGML